MRDLQPPDVPPPATGGGRLTPDPNLAFILNLLGAACAGYVLIGQKQKAIAGAIIFALLLIPPSCGTGSMLFALVAAVDALLQARQLAAGRHIGQWTFLHSSAAPTS